MQHWVLDDVSPPREMSGPARGLPGSPGSPGIPLRVLGGAGVDHKFLCSHCHLVLRDPVQTQCGHRYCRACIAEVCSAPGEHRCGACALEGEDPAPTLNLEEIVPDRALVREMARLPAVCPSPDCDWSGPLAGYLQHEPVCEHVPRPCPYGCPEEGTRRHMEEAVVTHTGLLLQRVTGLESGMGGSISGAAVDARLEAVRRQLAEIDAGQARYQVTGEGVTALAERQAVLESLVDVLSREMEAAAGRVTQLGAGSVQRRQDVDATRGRLQRLERTAALQEVTLAEASLRLDALEVTSHDGTLIWKMTGVARKRQDAARGQTLSVYSPPFSTGRGGYRLCLRAYPNGDGEGRGVYFSLFFVVMRGDYDALLSWPFRHKVTLMLMSQAGREHVMDAFRPDPGSSSFKRPQADMNVASGLPRFCPLSELDNPASGLVKDDTIFIKVVVDLG